MAEEKKVKEIPWAEPKMLYKDVEENGFDVYRKFNWETWKRMTEGERAMWTEASEATPAPISKEVIDFNKKIADKFPEHKDKTRDAGDEMLRKQSGSTFSVDPKFATGGVIDIVEAEKDAIKKELKKRKIKFTHNSKLETLKKKLADADNTE